MKKIFNQNGFVVWDESEIKLREWIVQSISDRIKIESLKINPAWKFYRIEAPVLLPIELISSEHRNADECFILDDLALAPETTASSYEYLKTLNERPPICVFQSRLSFRKEKDKTLKHMRLKQFYQLEFQFIYSDSSKADYPNYLKEKVLEAVRFWLKNYKLSLIPSDRLPSYSESTEDIIAQWDLEEMEIASLSQRKDCPIPGCKNFEIAIGLDRILYLAAS